MRLLENIFFGAEQDVYNNITSYVERYHTLTFIFLLIFRDGFFFVKKKTVDFSPIHILRVNVRVQYVIPGKKKKAYSFGWTDVQASAG